MTTTAASPTLSGLAALSTSRFSAFATSGTTLLAYALSSDPLPIQASPSPTSPVSATLTFVVDCPRATGTVSVRQLEVVIPVDPKDASPDPTNLAAVAPALSSVSITSSGTDLWVPSAGAGPGVYLFAPKGNTAIDVSGQSLTIVVSGVSVNSVVGTASVRVAEWAAPSGSVPPQPTDPSSGSCQFAVPKFPAGFTLGTFQGTPADIDPGADPTCSTTLSWNGSAGASYTIQYDDVTISHPADQPAQPLPPAGSYKVSNLQDDITVFTLVVEAGGGSVAVQQQATVSVNRARIQNFVAFPPVLGQNATCHLQWETNADTCYIGNDTVNAPNGSQTVTVNDDIDLTLTAMRGQDTTQALRHVQVVPPQAKSFVVLVNGAPVSGPVDAGTVVTFTWATQYAETIGIDQGIGTVSANSDPAKPVTATVNNSTTFTLTCTGKGPPVTLQAHVAVNPVQITAFTVSPSSVDPGQQTVTLEWATVRATSASIDGGVGPVSPLSSGSTDFAFNPQSDTTFTLTCGGPDGPIAAQAGMHVNCVRITGFDWNQHDQRDNISWFCTVDWSTELASSVTLAVDCDGVLDGFSANQPRGVGASGSLPFILSEFMNSWTFTLTAWGPGASPTSAQCSTPDLS